MAKEESKGTQLIELAVVNANYEPELCPRFVAGSNWAGGKARTDVWNPAATILRIMPPAGWISELPKCAAFQLFGTGR